MVSACAKIELFAVCIAYVALPDLKEITTFAKDFKVQALEAACKAKRRLLLLDYPSH